MEKLDLEKSIDEIDASVRPKIQSISIKPLSGIRNFRSTKTKINCSPLDIARQTRMGTTLDSNMRKSQTQSKFLLTQCYTTFQYNRRIIHQNKASVDDLVKYPLNDRNSSNFQLKTTLISTESAENLRTRRNKELLHKDIISQTKDVKVDDQFKKDLYGYRVNHTIKPVMKWDQPMDEVMGKYLTHNLVERIKATVVAKQQPVITK